MTVLIVSLFAVCLCAAPAETGEARAELRRRAEKMIEDGHYKDAWTAYESLLSDPAAAPGDIEADLPRLMSLIGTTGRTEKAEAILDRLAEERGDSWRVLAAVARNISEALPKEGYFLDGEFHRHRGWHESGQFGNVEARDRVEAINLMLRAGELLDAGADRAEAEERREFHGWFARIIAPPGMRNESWRLTNLTPLDPAPPPDPGPGMRHGGRGAPGAPVDGDGDPVFHAIPESWSAAGNDGERWRWALYRSAETNGRGREDADWEYASFLRDQFGVRTVDGRLPRQEGDDAANPFSVRTLDENETIARLASGIRRFRLPEDSDFIAIFRRLAEGRGLRAEQALKALGDIFENRQQYVKAAAAWRTLRDRHGAGDAAGRLDRITGNNGRLEPVPTLPAGTRPKLPFVFRNGSRVEFTAQRLDEELFIADIKAGMRKGGFDRDFHFPSPERIGYRVLEKGGSRYVRETTAEWGVDLNPLPDHFSRRIQVEMPFDRAGCYLVTAKMRGGNATRAVLWLSDLALARKTMGDHQVNYVADAVSGEPVPGAALSFFGYRMRHDRNRPDLETREFAETADKNGLALVPAVKFGDYAWLAAAKSAGRFAFIGFNQVWPMTYDSLNRDENRVSAFVMTDRPVYRPGQAVHFKAWLGSHSYDQTDAPPYVGEELELEIDNPMGETVHAGKYRVDEYGGIDGQVALDGSALLGLYRIRVGGYDEIHGRRIGIDLGQGGFRLEEYRKPEFEVTVKAPDKALLLGDTARIGVEAKYYFGSPVAGGAISYKITRTVQAPPPLPAGKWDWLYGRGYWWTGYDYDWYPGWGDWGTRRPDPSPLPPAGFPPFRFPPPELVAEGAGVLDAGGEYRITLETALAKAVMGDRDQRYTIEVEVADRSRRVVVGKGSVVAAAKPFSVTVWADRGYFRTGDDLTVNFAATLPAGGGVAGDGEAVLYKIAYAASGEPSEEKMASWRISSGADGSGEVRMRAGAPGQYRVSCAIADADGTRIEGAAIVAVRGEKGEAGDCRFSSLELTPEKREYRPGEVLRLAVGSAKKDAVALLFPHAGRPVPAGSEAGPVVLRLEDGQAVFEMDIGAAEQPNFFVEALTVYSGRMYNEIREVFVPPATRTLKVEVTPDSAEYRPGARAEFSVKVEDEYGRPVRGQCVVALYDRSLEHVAGGPTVGDIREHFWSWKRNYRPSARSSLLGRGYRVRVEGDGDWEPLGVFGSLEMDWNEATGEDAVPKPVTAGGMVMEDAHALSAPLAMGRNASFAPAPLPAPMAAADGGPAGRMPGTARPRSADAAGDGKMVEPALRGEFADTALWIAALETDSAGLARFGLAMPENLGAWKARVWSKAPGTRVGEGSAGTVTRKNVMVRVQTPRFLTQKDRVVLTANVHNYLPRDKDARVELELEGGFLVLEAGESPVKTVRMEAGGEARVNWIARAARPGEAAVRMKALTDEESDAAEIKVPVIVHGARRVENYGGALREGEDSLSFAVRVPEERLPEQSALRFGLSPAIVSTMLEALPFLAEYPYGCTEQTLNRFLPALMTRRCLERLGLSLGDIAGSGEAADRKRGEWLRRFGDLRGRGGEPVFDDRELDKLVKAGVERLTNMRNSDGGWGWFSGVDEASWPHTTAVVVYGLLKARDNGAAVADGVIEGGVDWLRSHQDRRIAALKRRLADKEKPVASGDRADNIDAFIYLVLAGQGRRNPEMRDLLYRDRLGLSLSALTMFAIALHEEGATSAFDTVFGNIGQYVERDERSGGAWLRRPSFGWWRWYNDEIETLAWYLKLLSRIDPKGGDAAAAARHLVRNRKNGLYWRSTRDTAYAVEALSDYAVQSGEAAPDMTVKVYYDDELVMRRVIKPENLLDDNVFVLEGAAVEAGEHVVRIEREGTGRLYCTGRLDVFSLEDPIAAAGGDLSVARAVHKLERDDRTGIAASAGGQAMARTSVGYRRAGIASPFESGAPLELKPGDLVEVELSIEAANDYEYIVFEDMKAAGLEPVEAASGYRGGGLGAYVEYRDQKVTMFVRDLPRGKHNLSYRLRAEVPGWFSALPAFGGGMYATDLFANSDEMKLKITEPGAFE
jgi:uncharacterized protein YfaS (alpha-2-macroglobulin family)